LQVKCIKRGIIIITHIFSCAIHLDSYHTHFIYILPIIWCLCNYTLKKLLSVHFWELSDPGYISIAYPYVICIILQQKCSMLLRERGQLHFPAMWKSQLSLELPHGDLLMVSYALVGGFNSTCHSFYNPSKKGNWD
jgi:hypothetical protein